MDHLFPFLADPADSSGTRRAGRDDLVLSVALPKTEYRKYEPVVFTLGVANQAKDIVNAVLPVWPTTRLLTIELKKDGNAFAQQIKWSGLGSAEVFRIPAGQVVRIELDLSALYPNGLEPGAYSLKVTYTHETLVLPAGEVPFTVTPAAADDEAAAKDLHAAYQSGGVQAFLGVIERHKDSVLVPQVRLELIREYQKARQPYSCVAQCRLIEQSPWATARMKLSALYQTAFALEEGCEYLMALRHLRQIPGSSHRFHIAQLQPKAKGMVDARIRNAERNIQQRAVEIVVHQNARPQKFVFAVPRMEPSLYPWITHCQIAADEANRILGVLIDSGFFEKGDSFDAADPHYPPPAVSVRVNTGKGFYEQNIGWGAPAATVLANLRKAVKDGTDAAHAMDKVLDVVRMERPNTPPGIDAATKPTRQGMPSRACYPPRRGAHEGSPTLSHDGRTLAWFHREDEKAFLCVLTSPWDKPSQRIEVRTSALHNYTDPIQLSGDGRHAFVNGQHVEIVGGVPVIRGVLPGTISYFGVAPSFDGSKVAAPIDDKDGGLKLLSREGNRYIEGAMLIPGRNGQPLRWPLISGDGNLALCELGDSLREATSDGATWKERAVAFELKIGMTPLAMSDNGQTLLLQGFTFNRGRTVENIYLSSRDGHGHWQEPKLLLDNTGATVYNCGMSPDAKTIVWVHYTRDDKGSITRTELQFMRRQGNGWTEPSTIFDKEGCVQFMSIALSNTDVLGYALADRSKPPGSCTVFLRPGLKPETLAININEQVVAKP